MTRSHQETVPHLLKDLRFLIADASSGSKSIRALLGHFKVKSSQIDSANTVTEAQELIFIKKPNVVFADFSLGNGQGLSLLDLQKAALSPKLPRIFFLSTSVDSKMMISGAVEADVDQLIIKPFTMQALQTLFVETCINRLAPPPYLKAVQEAQALLQVGDAEGALSGFIQAKALDPKPALAWAGEGAALQSLSKKDEALHSFETGLKIDENHYRSLIGALECCIELGRHEQAYEFSQRITKNHTLPLQKIPDLIRLSIVTGRFPEVIEFFAFADAIMKVHPAASTYLGAGLVVCGIFFTRHGDRKKAIDAFRKAEVASQNNPKIQKRLISAMIAAGFDAEFKALLNRLPSEVQNSIEVRLAELERLEKTAPAADVLKAASDLHKMGIKEKRVFEILVQRSIELERKDAVIQDLVDVACTLFPDDKEYFEKLARSASTG